MYQSDEEWDAAVRASFEYFPSPAQLAIDQLNAEERVSVIHAAERYHCLELPTGEKLPDWLGSDPTVRKQVHIAMMEQHRGRPWRRYGEYEPPLRGTPQPYFDENDPGDSRQMFVVFADQPQGVHWIWTDTVERLVARKTAHRYLRCDWRKLNPGRCVDYSNNVVCFSRGQYVVVFRTCFLCRDWLLAGAPDTDQWQ